MSKKNVVKIYDAGGDLSKRWFVYHTVEGKRKKVYGDINSYLTLELRLVAANIIIEEIASGIKKKIDFLSNIEKALLTRSISAKTKSDYKAKYRRFKTYCEMHALKAFTIENARGFASWLKEEGIFDTTINDYVMLMRSAFKNLIEENKFSEANPFQFVHLYKADSTPARYYTNAQVREMMNEIKLDEHLYLFIGFIYYCFIRPGELRQLKVSDVIIDEKRIRVPAPVSKNRKTQYVTIPNAFFDEVEAFVNKRPQKEWLFMSERYANKQIGKNTMYYRHRDILEKLGYDNTQYCVYSWKHTGAVACVKAGISLKFLQIQLRHSSLDMVNKYLRQLGVDDLSELQDKFPSILK